MALELGLKSDFQECYFQRISPRKQIRAKVLLQHLACVCNVTQSTSQVKFEACCPADALENGVKGKRDQVVIYVSQAIRGPVGLWPEPVSCQAKCWLMPGDPSPSWNYKFIDAYILQILQTEKATPPPPPLQGSPINNRLGEVHDSTQGQREGDRGP